MIVVSVNLRAADPARDSLHMATRLFVRMVPLVHSEAL